MKVCAVAQIVLAVCLMAPSVFAQDSAVNGNAVQKRIADVIDIAPWGFAGADGQPAGVYTHVFRRLSERSGCILEPRLTPITRAVMEVSRGSASATIMLDRADLNENAVLLGEVAELRIEVWLPPGSTLRSLNDLAGKTVGVLRGPNYHEGFNRDARILKRPVTNPRQQLEMLIKGRLDAAIGVRENFLITVAQMRIQPSAFAPPIKLGQRSVNLWVAPNLRDTPCAEQWRQALKDMRRDGEIKKLFSGAETVDQ